MHCNPVFVSYLLISPENITLYINNVKLPDDVKAYLMSEHIDVQAYESVVEGLRLYAGKSLLVDMSSTTIRWQRQCLLRRCARVFLQLPV